jgi:hypothetical protein
LKNIWSKVEFKISYHFPYNFGLIVFIVVVINLPLVSCACTSNKIEFIDVIKMLSLLYMVSLGDFVGAYNN